MYQKEDRMGIRERLAKGVAILEELEQMRLRLGDPRWGFDTEYAIIVAELWDLEEDILCDPGALESMIFPAA
jgi:hypothetical protein